MKQAKELEKLFIIYGIKTFGYFLSHLCQICDAEDVTILKGVVSKDHVRMHIGNPPSPSVSTLIKKLKGRSSRKLQQEFPALKHNYWGRHF